MTGLARPTPYSWSVGDIFTAAIGNGVRDGLTFSQNPPMFIGTQSAAQSIANATWVSLGWDTTITDPYAGHSNTVNNSRYVAQVAGYYAAAGVASYVSNGTGYRATSIAVNGTIVKAGVGWWVTSDPGDTIAVPSPVRPVFLNIGDYVELKTAQNSGGALNTNVAADLSSALAVWLIHA